MLNHNPPIMDEDETAVPVGTAILPTTMTVGHGSSKKVTKTTGRSFGRVIARVGVGLLLLLLVAEGATVLPEEEEKGALWLDRGSFSPGRRTTAQRVVGADRAATAAAEEDGVVVTEDGHDSAEAVVTPRRGTNKNSKKTTKPLVAVLVPEPALVPEPVPAPGPELFPVPVVPLPVGYVAVPELVAESYGGGWTSNDDTPDEGCRKQNLFYRTDKWGKWAGWSFVHDTRQTDEHDNFQTCFKKEGATFRYNWKGFKMPGERIPTSPSNQFCWSDYNTVRKPSNDQRNCSTKGAGTHCMGNKDSVFRDTEVCFPSGSNWELVSQGKITSCGNRCRDFVSVKNRIRKPTYEPVPEVN